jgi:hypothetical protein
MRAAVLCRNFSDGALGPVRFEQEKYAQSKSDGAGGEAGGQRERGAELHGEQLNDFEVRALPTQFVAHLE